MDPDLDPVELDKDLDPDSTDPDPDPDSADTTAKMYRTKNIKRDTFWGSLSLLIMWTYPYIMKSRFQYVKPWLI
jgi:hypothetical protein